MNAVGDNYTKVTSAPFDGTVMPIAYIPDWTKTENQDKSKRFEAIPISEFLPIPLYDPIALLDKNNTSKSTTIIRYTYPALYMGNYNLDYRENAGGHLWVDIRAPIGTPILSVANGVVVRVVAGDATGNKFIVIRHDNVPMEGGRKTLYSWYLHLSEILVQEGNIVKKWDMIGRVGISGITTTPHLHFQIDNADAPFHPYWHFTTSESRSAGLGFFDSINVGLNKDKAQKYTIHPMIFLNTFLGWVESTRTADIKIPLPPEKKERISNTTSPSQPTRVIASYTTEDDGCIGKRFSDVSSTSAFGKLLYPLVDKKCLFFEVKNTLGTKETLTYKEALINTMRYFDITPTGGTSHFLDIPLGDTLQGYALVAYRRGILDGNYAYPDRIMSREEVATLIVKVAQGEKNPSQIRIYADVDPMNPSYQSIQDYGFLVQARWWKFYPKTLVTRGTFIQMLTSIKK
jgi:murein DD-endopeptidase MepM/ murein hydrolase activator NlpD